MWCWRSPLNSSNSQNFTSELRHPLLRPLRAVPARFFVVSCLVWLFGLVVWFGCLVMSLHWLFAYCLVVRRLICKVFWAWMMDLRSWPRVAWGYLSCLNSCSYDSYVWNHWWWSVVSMLSHGGWSREALNPRTKAWYVVKSGELLLMIGRSVL